jgi:hypothetical protein
MVQNYQALNRIDQQCRDVLLNSLVDNIFLLYKSFLLNWTDQKGNTHLQDIPKLDNSTL